MIRSHRNLVTVACAVLLVLGLSATVLISKAAAGATVDANYDDALMVSSPAVIKRLSLGYSGVLADFYWTRAVQYFGRKHVDGASGYRLLAPILTITTELDPKLTIAYDYGSIFLAQKPPEGAGDPKAAVALVERGIQQNPGNWHLYYTLGFIYSMELKDYHAAARAFAEGARVPGAHPWMRVIAAGMAEHGGEPAMAHYMWTQMYQATADKMLFENAEKHLRASEVQMDVAALQQMVDDYTAQTGHAPARLEELVRPGFLFRLPKDPFGYYYVLGPGNRVGVQHPTDFPFLELDEKTDPLVQFANKPK